MGSCRVTTKRGREVLRNLRFLTISAPCTWALRQSTGNADHFPSPTNCKRVLNTRFRPCVPWADMVRTCATFSIGYAGYEPIRIPVMLSSPDWAAGLIRSTAGSFSDYVSVSLREASFRWLSGADPVSIENMLSAGQPDYNLSLVSCRLIFPGMRS